jgi:GNAT superfamily N-acetyltransferase
MINVRPVTESDKAAWLPLWHGYLTFYKTELPASQDDLTWSRLLDPTYESHGLVVEKDGVVQGITHYSFQTSTWAPVNYCYLEDLFVNSDLRGGGLGRALIDAVKEIAIAAGSSRLYWNTDGSNEVARKLYDTYTPHSEKVQYRIPLL